MALPPLVVSGAVISAAHINSIRNHLASWTVDVDAGGNDLTNLGQISGQTAVFAGGVTGNQFATLTMTVSGEISGGSATITGALSSASLSVSGNVTAGSVYAPIMRMSGDTLKYFEAESAHLAFVKKTGAFDFYWRRNDTGHSDGANQVDLMNLNDSGNLSVLGSVTAASISITGAFSTSTGVVKISPQSAGAGEGGELQLSDSSGTSFWSVDNKDQNLRLFRSGLGGVQMSISSTGKVTIGSYAGTTPSYVAATVTDTVRPYDAADSGLGSFKIGGPGQTEQGILFGNYDDTVSLRYGWIQQIIPGFAPQPLLINTRGGGVVLSAPTAPVADAAMPTNTLTFYVDEVNHRVYLRIRESSGVFRGGYVQV